MKGLLIALAAIVALTHAAPQGGVEFTAREYQAFQQALGDRIPVAIQSAIRVLASAETNPTDFIVLNFNGLSGAEPAPPALISSRTGSLPTDDDVAEIFSEVANDAVEDVEDAAADAADEADLDEEEVNRTDNNDDDSDDAEALSEAVPLSTDTAGGAATQTSLNLTPVAEETANESPAVNGVEESRIAKSLVENSLDDVGIDIVDPTTNTPAEAEVDDAAAVTTSGLAAEAEEDVDNEVTPEEEAVRRKRQHDEEDVNLNRNAQELALALSALGGFYVGRV